MILGMVGVMMTLSLIGAEFVVVVVDDAFSCCCCCLLLSDENSHSHFFIGMSGQMGKGWRRWGGVGVS